MYTGLDVVDQSRWESITPRHLPSLQAWTSVNGALDRVLQDSPNIIGSLKTPSPLETIDVETVPYYECDENEDLNVNEDEDEQDMEALWIELQEKKRPGLVRINNDTLNRLGFSQQEAQRFKASNDQKAFCTGYRDATSRYVPCPRTFRLSLDNTRLFDRRRDVGAHSLSKGAILDSKC